MLTAIKKWSRQHKYPFYFSTECSINLADDENLMQLMKDVDFRYVFIGIETPEETALLMTHKTANMNRSIGSTIKKIYSYGMIVNAGFIIGFDHESDQIAENMIECIQDSGIAMAMLGMLYALPDTQLSRRLTREGRLFKDSSTLRDDQKMIDQTSSGLNFITNRPRIDILRDFLRIESVIYDPENYFKRVTDTALRLNCKPRYKPGFIKRIKSGLVMIKLSRQLGNNGSTARPYYKMAFNILLKNPRGYEPALNLSAMFIHFHKQSQFIMKHIASEIEAIEWRQQKRSEIDEIGQYVPQNVLTGEFQ